MNKYIGKNIFIFGSEVEDENPVAMYMCSKPKEIKTYLNNMMLQGSTAPKLIHGVYTSAISIPKNIDNNISIYVVLENANSLGDSYIIEIDDLLMLEEVIYSLINKNITEMYPNENEMLDLLYEIDTQKIEDINILYGYEIPLGLTFSGREIKLPVIKTATTTFKKLKAYQK